MAPIPAFPTPKEDKQVYLIREIMAGYHDLVDRGRREIFHVEG